MRPHHINEPHDDIINPSAVISRNCTKKNTNHQRQYNSHYANGKAYPHTNYQPAKDIAAIFIGAE